MKIKKIKIDKFRKLENVEVNELGIINELYGSNGCGKTSFISFITWIIYGETLDYGVNDEMNIDTFKPYEYISGEITFDKDYKLARTYGIDENGKVKNDFFSNGRKCKNQKEYYECVNEVFDITGDIKIKGLNLIRALSDPYYLINKPNEFRELISRLINIDTYNILFEDEKYQLIKEDYDKQKKDFETCKDYYNSKINETNNDITKIKDIIRDYKTNYVKTEINIDELNSRREILADEINKVIIKHNNDLINKQKEFLSKQNEVSESIIKDRNHNELNEKLFELKMQYNELCDLRFNAIKTNEENNNKKLKIDLQLKEYDEAIIELKKSKFVEIHCPKCDTLINENDYKKFNTNKVNKINEIKNICENLLNEKSKICEVSLKDIENSIDNKIKEIKDINDKINEIDSYKSDNTILLEKELSKLNDEYMYMLSNNDNLIKEKTETLMNELKQLDEEIAFYNHNKTTLDNINSYTRSLNNALEQKAIYENKLSLLKNFKNEEVLLLKKNTTKIFGNEFDFEMLVKNKSNDNYKKVCYASIDGLEHQKENTANYLYYSIVMLEKVKQYINPNCDIPIIFDIADNLGEKATKNITDVINNSQIFYTRIEWKDNVERQLKIIK